MAETYGRLIIRLGEEVVDTVRLTAPVTTIGRNPDNLLPLPQSTMISRYHADVRPDPQGIVVTDLGSANGTFVGDEQLLPHQPRLITPGGVVRIGPYELIFEAAEPAPPEQDDPEPQAALPPPTQQPDKAETEARSSQSARLQNDVKSSVSNATEPEAEPPGNLTRRERLMAGLPSAPPPLPDWRQPSRYQNLLPLIFHENDFLRRYLLIFETIWEPFEYRQDHIEMYFDPRTCPPSMISWLASWFGLTINPHWPEGRRRQVLNQIFDLYRWRGTQHGLALMIELSTGLTPLIEDLDEPFVFRIRMQLPPNHPVDREFLETLIETHKPAHAGYILELTA